MLRRQKPKGPGQRLVFVSCGGNESVGTTDRGVGGRPSDVKTRDPPGLEASKKKRPGTGLPELEKKCFCLSDMGESGTSHELTLLTYRELGLVRVSISTNLTTS
ncbi:hypothetical protein PBY51_023492 [Eleginops maclovinus]|nr:hypothetical protein PBY51_023492 [Eleginops maclovinus]